MTEVLLFVGAASLLVFGAATLFVATLALRTARRYVELAEERMERLRKGQARLVALGADGRRVTEAEATFERELEELREARRKIPVAAAAAGSPEAHRGGRGPEGGGRREEGAAPIVFPDTSTTSRKKQPAADGAPSEARRPRLGARHPHPDDGADLARSAPSKPSRARSSSAAPVEMFRKHYDRYLENYAGYVELAASLHRARDEAGTRPGSSEERDREERLGRVNDGIKRTVARLDILEGLNPGLAADDRVSRRASIALRHAELSGEGGVAGRP